jgi:hypothetical protein
MLDAKNAISLTERKRTYFFANGKVELSSVKELIVRESGTHRIKTDDGKLHIIPSGWLHIEIDADNWTV